MGHLVYYYALIQILNFLRKATLNLLTQYNFVNNTCCSQNMKSDDDDLYFFIDGLNNFKVAEHDVCYV